MSSRRYPVTRAEVQALPRFVNSAESYDEEEEEEIIEESSANDTIKPSASNDSQMRCPVVHEGVVDGSVDHADEYDVVDEEEIIDEVYEEIIEEEILEDDPLSPFNKSRKGMSIQKSIPENANSSVDHSEEPKSAVEEDEHGDDEESLPDAEDVLEALKYILRQEKPVENGYITSEQEEQMLALPLSEMVDIMKHFELCDNENAQIRWDLVCLMIHAVEDNPPEHEEVIVDDHDDEDSASGSGALSSDNNQEAHDEFGSLGSGYDLDARGESCDSDISEFNESEIITE